MAMLRMKKCGGVVLRLSKYRKGAASFYIVAIATLALTIVATSFAMVVVSEVSRSSNSELARSAYDSAMAGVEDAKLAYANYQRCVVLGSYEDALSDGAEVTCQDIVYYMNHPSCDMVGWILGRIPKGVESEVAINDTVAGGGSETNQAYTCVKIDSVLNDYRSTLAEGHAVRVIKPALSGISANEIKKIKLSWYTNSEEANYNYLNTSGALGENARVVFPLSSETVVAVPPVVALQIIQTHTEFRVTDFDYVNSAMGLTDRATVYLVPSDSATMASGGAEGNYVGVGKAISKNLMAQTNDDNTVNLPMVVDCSDNESDEFACSVEIELPDVISTTGGGVARGVRSNETFRLVVALPYGRSDTDFAVEFLCGEGACSNGVAKLEGAQVKIDSTGRANDLYRRVEVRLEAEADESGDEEFPYYAVQLNGADERGWSLIKDLTVTGR